VWCDSLPLTWHVELCGGILYYGWQRFCGCYKHFLLYCLFQIISSMRLVLTTSVYRDDALGRSRTDLNLVMKDHLTVIQLDLFVLSCVWLPLYWLHWAFLCYHMFCCHYTDNTRPVCVIMCLAAIILMPLGLFVLSCVWLPLYWLHWAFLYYHMFCCHYTDATGPVCVIMCLVAIVLTPLSFYVYKIRIKLQSLL
jgi:hypothetical protein